MTIERSTQALPSILLPTARVAGPYAHVLTLGTGIVAQQMNTLRFGDGELARLIDGLAASHLATYHRPTERFLTIFERDGTPIELIERFQLRDRSVFLYRVVRSDQRTSTFEEGVQAIGRGDLSAAEGHFRTVIEAFPAEAPAWCKLGIVYRDRRDPDRARVCFEEALRRDPNRVEAHVELANLFGSSGYLEEAYLHLGAASKAAPDSDHLRSQYHELHVRLGLGGGTP